MMKSDKDELMVGAVSKWVLLERVSMLRVAFTCGVK